MSKIVNRTIDVSEAFAERKRALSREPDSPARFSAKVGKRVRSLYAASAGKA